MTPPINRRLLLRGLTAGLGYAAASSLLRKDAVSAGNRNIRWAFGMYTWVVFHRPNPVPLRKVLEETAAVGFQGVEFFDYEKLLKENNLSDQGIKDLLDEFELDIVSVYFAGAFHDRSKQADLFKTMKETCRYLSFHGADRLVIGPPGYKGDDEKGVLGEMARFLSEAGKMALEEYNIKICIHPHLNTVIENPRQIYRSLEESDPRYVFFVPDTGHMWLGGADPVKAMEDFKDRIAYVHYKDAKGFVVKPEFFENVVEMGRGDIDFPAAHRILKDIAYKGWITIDLDYARESPLASAKIHGDYVASVLDPIYR